MNLDIEHDSFRLAEAFAISRGSKTEAHVITVCLSEAGFTGRAECFPYARYFESQESVTEQIESLRGDLQHSPSIEDLQTLIGCGAARNALDCALWDLRARQAGVPVWTLAGLPEPQPLTTAYTLSLSDPESMKIKAARNAGRPILKIKLGGKGDVDRIRAVRAGAPDAAIVVDANEGWTPDDYESLAPVFVELGVKMVEQPFPAAEDAVLADMERPLTVCADESCHGLDTVDGLRGKYDMINIKLDKTGGLTEALQLEQVARQAGFQVMVGCMVSSSLAMAPALLVAQQAEVVDLDGPLLLAEDRQWPMRFDGSVIHPADSKLWG